MFLFNFSPFKKGHFSSFTSSFDHFFRSKEIEFVVPPTISPYSSNRNLSRTTIINPAVQQRPHSQQNTRRPSGSNTPGEPGFVNKGWNLLQDVLHASNTLQVAGKGRSSRSDRTEDALIKYVRIKKATFLCVFVTRSASLSVSTLALNTCSGNGYSSLAPKHSQERRASTNSIYLAPGGVGGRYVILDDK